MDKKFAGIKLFACTIFGAMQKVSKNVGGCGMQTRPISKIPDIKQKLFKEDD